MSTETFTTTASTTTSNLAPEEHRSSQPRTMKRPNAPAFYNPFHDSSSPSSKPTKSFPGVSNPFGSSHRSAENAGSPGAETPSSAAARSRTSSFFQSIYSNGSSGASPSERKGSIFSRKGSSFGMSRKESVSQAYMLDASPKLGRRPSYVPKYAASSHLASMTGRTTAPGVGSEIEGQLRRGSRMMSVVPGEMGSPSRLIHSAVPEAVEGN